MAFRPPAAHRDESKSYAHQMAHWQHSGRGYDLVEIESYQTTDNWEKRAKSYGRLAASRNIPNQVIAGRMAVELAEGAADPTEWFDRATTLLTQVVKTQQCSYQQLQSESAIAKRTLAFMPHYFGQFTQGTLPDATWHTRISQQLLGVAAETAASYDAARARMHIPAERVRSMELSGELAEQAVLLLGLREAIAIGDGTWAPAPSLFSQDHAYSFNSGSAINYGGTRQYLQRTGLSCLNRPTDYK